MFQMICDRFLSVKWFLRNRNLYQLLCLSKSICKFIARRLELTGQSSPDASGFGGNTTAYTWKSLRSFQDASCFKQPVLAASSGWVRLVLH